MLAARWRGETIRREQASSLGKAGTDLDWGDHPYWIGQGNALAGAVPAPPRPDGHHAPDPATTCINFATHDARALFGGEEDAEYRAYDDRDAVLTGVWEALEILDRAVPMAGAFVRTALTVVAIRQDLASEHPYSSSWRTMPTLAGLTNVHQSPDLRAFVINALVHESIHSVLYCYESRAPFVIGRPCPELRFPSPWTRAQLRPESYLHACHVWFGLVQLWTLLSDCEHGDIPAETAAAFLGRARRGFPSSPASTLREHASLFSSEAVLSVQAMTRRVAALLKRARDPQVTIS